MCDEMLDRQVHRPIEVDDQDVASAMDGGIHLVAESKNKPGETAADVSSHLGSDWLTILRRGLSRRERHQCGHDKCQAKSQKARA